MAQDPKPGLRPEALAWPRSRIEPASVAHTPVSGEYWQIYLRPHMGSAEQITIGVALKFSRPPIGLLWRLAQPEIVRDFYNDATLEQWRWMISEAEDALAAGEENSPAPNSIFYGPRLPFQGRSPERALDVLYNTVIGESHGLLAPRQRGGLADNPEQTTSEILRSVTQQLGLAAQAIEQFGRATVYQVDHHLVTTLDLAPSEGCEHHQGDILTASGKMSACRHHHERMAVCALLSPESRQIAAELIARLTALDISFISDDHPAKLRLKVEQMLAEKF